MAFDPAQILAVLFTPVRQHQTPRCKTKIAHPQFDALALQLELSDVTPASRQLRGEQRDGTKRGRERKHPWVVKQDEIHPYPLRAECVFLAPILIVDRGREIPLRIGADTKPERHSIRQIPATLEQPALDPQLGAGWEHHIQIQIDVPLTGIVAEHLECQHGRRGKRFFTLRIGRWSKKENGQGDDGTASGLVRIPPRNRNGNHPTPSVRQPPTVYEERPAARSASEAC